MPGAYAVADALALPSATETWGLVVNEAMACGLPVAASDTVGCVPDLVDEGVTGTSYPAGGGVGALAGALERLLPLVENPATRRALASEDGDDSLERCVEGVLGGVQGGFRRDVMMREPNGPAHGVGCPPRPTPAGAPRDRASAGLEAPVRTDAPGELSGTVGQSP